MKAPLDHMRMFKIRLGNIGQEEITAHIPITHATSRARKPEEKVRADITIPAGGKREIELPLPKLEHSAQQAQPIRCEWDVDSPARPVRCPGYSHRDPFVNELTVK